MRCELLPPHLYVMQMQLPAAVSSPMIGQTAAAADCAAAAASAAPIAAAAEADVDFASG